MDNYKKENILKEVKKRNLIKQFKIKEISF